MIEKALYAILTGNADLAAVINTRVYPAMLPQKPTYPAVTYSRLTTGREISHDGPSGLANPQFTFSCWGSTYLQAREVANLLRAALEGYKGTAEGVNIGSITCEDDRDEYDEAVKVHYAILDFSIWHDE